MYLPASVFVGSFIGAMLLVASLGASPASAANDDRATRDGGTAINVGALREEALARLAPQVRDALRGVRIEVVARPLPRTAPGAAACFDMQTGVIMLGADLEQRYGRDFARSALIHEYGHALAWLRFHWDLREFRTRFLSAVAMPGAEKYPVFAEFVRRHYEEALTKTDYSELFPALLLEARSSSVLPPPLRAYLAPLMWP